MKRMKKYSYILLALPLLLAGQAVLMFVFARRISTSIPNRK